MPMNTILLFFFSIGCHLRGEVAAHHLVHALEHDLAIDALHIQHALVAQQPLAVDLQDAAEEVFETIRIERLIAAVDERLDLVVVVRVMVMRGCSWSWLWSWPQVAWS